MADETEPSTPEPSRWGVALYWLLPLTLLLYLPSLAAGFIYDDLLLIANNAYVQSFEYLGRAFTTHFWDTPGGDHVETLRYYRPLISASYILDWQLAGGAPFVFHLHNALLHTVAVGLAARWSQRLLGTRSKLWLLPALLFAFHPTRLESVVWISGRTDLWLSVWLLLAVEAAARARQRSKPAFVVVSAVCAVAALLSKETAVILPLLLLSDRAAENPVTREPKFVRRYADVLLASAIASVYLGCRSLWLPVGSQVSTITPASFLAACEGYLERIFWPVPEGFFFRPMAINEQGNLHATWQVALGVVVVLASLALLLYAFKKDRSALGLIASAIVSLAPVLQLVPTGLPVLVADRFVYLPLLLLALGVCRLFQSQLRGLIVRFPRPSVAALVAIPLTLAASLALVVPSHASERAFWQTELERRPCTPAAHEHLAKLDAAQSDLGSAKEHLLLMLSAECISQTLYHRQLPLRAYARTLQIEAAHTADGDAERLTGIATRLGELYAGKLRPKPAIVGLKEPAAPFFKLLSEQRRRLPDKGAVAAEVAGLLTRLGQDQRALSWAKRAIERPLTEQAAPANLVLTLARLGKFTQALQLVGRLEQVKPAGLISQAQAKALRRRIGQVADAAREAEHASPEQAAFLRAQAQANLGAYGRALRILEPSIREHTKPGPTVLYVQLLVAARLEREAYDVLSKTQAPGRARQILGRIQRGLSPELQSIAPVTVAPML